MPDENLTQHLERERFKGRDDYPIRAVWNSILAGIVYQHPSIENLRRELSCNNQLRRMYGFAADKITTASVCNRFIRKLIGHQKLTDVIFENLVEQCYEQLPGFGKCLALDGKAIRSHATGRNITTKKDGRREIDADYGVKTYKENAKTAPSGRK